MDVPFHVGSLDLKELHIMHSDQALCGVTGEFWVVHELRMHNMCRRCLEIQAVTPVPVPEPDDLPDGEYD
jgi:hypothetical protein